jgi:hypothetical protein
MRDLLTGLILFISIQLCAQDRVYNKGAFQIHEVGKIACFGDFVNDSTIIENKGVLYIAGGGGIQTLSGDASFIFDSMVVNNPSHILIEQELRIVKNINFTLGNLITNRDSMDSHYVHFLAGSTYDGASDVSFVDGVVAKTGNTAFDFPIGDTDEFHPLTISEPDINTDQFKAYYLHQDPDADFSTTIFDGSCLDHLSNCEYWVLDRTIGSSAVSVGLFYNASSCGVDVPCDLLVARWDGTKWVSEGNGGIVGTVDTGIVSSGDGCGTCGSIQEVTDFSPFTLGSSTMSNPLPITLVDFLVSQKAATVVLHWKSESEINNDYYTIERSEDGINWHYLGVVDGAGNSSDTLHYRMIDQNPLFGVSYYRLQQVDFDGAKRELGVESVNFSFGADYTIHPNPTSGSIKIYYSAYPPDKVVVYSDKGQLVGGVKPIEEDGFISIFLQDIPPGIYYVHLIRNNNFVIKKVLFI